MRLKMLGLLAIGGAVAYAHKKRGGEMTLASFKDTLANLGTQARDKIEELRSSVSNQGQMADSDGPDGRDARDGRDGRDGFDTQYSSGFGSDTSRMSRH